jgi:hypothetical protein
MLRLLAGTAAGGLAALAVANGSRGGLHLGPPPASAGTQGPAPKASKYLVGPQASPDTSPVLGDVVQQFTTMTVTRYQHQDEEDPQAGTYYYDCVGMTTYTMRRATPNAVAAVLNAFDIAHGFVPTPSHYAQFFFDLADTPSPYWQQITRVSDLQPGGILAWNVEVNNPDPTTPGHSVIAAGPPVLLSNGSYALFVYDSTATPHGPSDSRLTDPRNEIGPNGKPSGLGHGTIQLFVDTTGAPNGIAWTVSTRNTPQQIAMARPLS